MQRIYVKIDEKRLKLRAVGYYAAFDTI